MKKTSETNEEKRNSSPTSSDVKKDERSKTQKLENLDFFDALKLVMSGSSIARREWKVESLVYLSDGFLCIDVDGKKNQLILRDVDINATDWFVIEY